MIQERLEKLRALMKDHHMDAYLVETSDFHGSEYVGDYFKCRAFISGFTGSAGTVVVTADKAGLWTDGRYFLQAAQQLEGTGITLYRMGQPGVPSIEEFLIDNLASGGCLGFDGRTVNAAFASRLQRDFAPRNISICYVHDLIGEIWEDRPAMSQEPVMLLDTCYSGCPREEKFRKIRQELASRGADILVLTSLDDIAWLLNIRGGDVAYNPVLLSYLVLSSDKLLLFSSEKAIPAPVKAQLEASGVTFYGYDDIYAYIRSIPPSKTVWLDETKANYSILRSLQPGVEILSETNPTLLPKAVKNEVEVHNERIAHIKDGVAMVKFIYWLKHNVGKIPMTEMSVGDYLANLRREQEHSMGLSFESIIGYAQHGAIVHYSATPETDAALKPENFLLVDSGGQYLEGTTDITRTISLGAVSEQQKLHYTAVLRGHLNLTAAKFLYGCRGVNLDYLARSPLWELGLDYDHGTGHGVGYFLNVHEAPNGFRWKIVPERNDSAVFEEGMITSNEPGFYLAGEYGIRLENMIVCRKAQKTPYGQFMCFENLTFVPFDRQAIAPELMSERERALLNEYHAQVYEKISPYLTREESDWLREETKPL